MSSRLHCLNSHLQKGKKRSHTQLCGFSKPTSFSQLITRMKLVALYLLIGIATVLATRVSISPKYFKVRGGTNLFNELKLFCAIHSASSRTSRGVQFVPIAETSSQCARFGVLYPSSSAHPRWQGRTLEVGGRLAH